MTKLNRTQKSLLLGSLVALVLVMGIAYAAFGTRLNISGTSKIDSKWDIEIISITPNKEASCTNKEDISTCTTVGDVKSSVGDNKLSATFNAALISPGDSVVYTITVQNKGNLDAKLDTISKTPSTNNAIQINESGIKAGDELKAGESKSFTITVSYDSNLTSQPSNTEASFTINLNFIQSDGTGKTYENPNNPSSTLTKLGITTDNMSSKGLVADTVENGRYYYRGANPDNYITFNGEEAGWRIVSIEDDGTIKIIRTDSIGKMPFDEKGARNKDTSTYCQQAAEYGCDAWAMTSKLRSNVSAFSTALASGTYIQYGIGGGTSVVGKENSGEFSGTVTEDATLNTFLNTTYYNNPDSNSSYLNSTSRSQIVSHAFKVSSPGDWEDTESLELDVEQEGYYLWNGYVGLINITDYMRATSNNTCTSLKVGNYFNDSSGTKCGTNNWLRNSTSSVYWTMSARTWYSHPSVWLADCENGSLNASRADYDGHNVRPVVFLNSNLTLKGSGTQGDPFTIE